MRSVTKKLDHVIFYNDGTFSILNVRASYPHLDKPFAYRGEGGDSTSPPKYQVKLLIPKTSEYTPSVLAIRDAINTALRQADIPSLPANRKCLKDGDLSEKPEEAGMYILAPVKRVRRSFWAITSILSLVAGRSSQTTKRNRSFMAVVGLTV
jgi:hypothetical protein